MIEFSKGGWKYSDVIMPGTAGVADSRCGVDVAPCRPTSLNKSHLFPEACHFFSPQPLSAFACSLIQIVDDENTYICGSINGYAVVVATCPEGETGNVNAGRSTGSMFKTFHNIRMAVLVGIGGGIPGPVVSEDSLDNVHLRDVVVGWPGDGKPACVYHDRGRSKIDQRAWRACVRPRAGQDDV